MERIVYLLGAGFSAPLGLPVMSNFLELSKDQYFKHSAQYEHFLKVFELIRELSVAKNYIDTNLYNIEDILSILEMENLVGISSSIDLYKKYLIDVVSYYTPIITEPNRMIISDRNSNWIEKTFADKMLYLYINFVLNLLQLRIVRNFNNRTINSFIREGVDIEYSIVTLNYDLVVENVIEYANKYFPIQNKKITYTPEEEKLNYHISIAKLHGSINSEIIPPTWNKRHSENIAHHWKEAHKLLSNANHIRILGYSLPVTDNYIKFLFASSLSKTTNLKTIDVITLDPDGKTQNRYKQLFHPYPNFRFANSNIVDYLSYNYNPPRTGPVMNNPHIKRFDDSVEHDFFFNFDGEILNKKHNQFMVENCK